MNTPASLPLSSASVSASAVGAPSLPPTTWTTGSTEVFKTGTWRAALPRHIEAPSPCHRACPVNGEIAEWIGLARAGQYREAFDVLVRHNPFPAIAGRVCHHPCEAACNRGAYDEAVSICKLERFVGDRALAEGWGIAPLPPPSQSEQPSQSELPWQSAQPWQPAQPSQSAPTARTAHVAVIGAGPAGLSAAYQLRRRGWRVTVFEAGDAPGGLLRHGIPAYRLPRDVLEGEIARLLALGIELRCNEPVATAAQFEALRAAHDAVFVATGAARVKRLAGVDYADPRVMDGAAYLRAANAGAPPPLGMPQPAPAPPGRAPDADAANGRTAVRSVVVIGGGSAALDAARSARRAGHAVTVLALETRAQMPAQPDEVEEALEEGIALVDGAQLLAARATAAGLELECRQVRFEPGAERGTFSVTPIAGTEFRFGADAVLTSIGQDPELAPFGSALARDGSLLAIDRDGATTAGAVWAGGDVASLGRFVTEAVGMGRRAALAIHRHLLGAQPSPALAWPAVPPGAIATWYHGPAPRATAGRLGAELRLDGREVQFGLDADEARAESERCFSCGRCVACDNCITVCPDLAVRRRGAATYEVLADYCKGCGLCVRECPTGSMTMQQEAR